MKKSEQQAQFNKWLELHRGILFKVVRSYAQDPSQQEDLFQEIAIKLWKSIPKFQGKCKESTWIYRVAFFAASTWKRDESKHRAGREVFEETENALVRNNEPTNARLDWLYEQIHKLDEPDRSITLLLLDRYNYKEIADIVGLSETAIGARINRIKSKLTKNLKEENQDNGL